MVGCLAGCLDGQEEWTRTDGPTHIYIYIYIYVWSPWPALGGTRASGRRCRRSTGRTDGRMDGRIIIIIIVITMITIITIATIITIIVH